MSNCIPNNNPALELVEVRGATVVTSTIVAWHVGARSAEPVTLGGYGERWCVHDRATGRAETPDGYSGMLHDTLRYLGFGEPRSTCDRGCIIPNKNPQLECVEVVFDEGTGRVTPVRTPLVEWSVRFVEGDPITVPPSTVGKRPLASHQWFINDRRTGEAWNATMEGTFDEVLQRCAAQCVETSRRTRKSSVAETVEVA